MATEMARISFAVPDELMKKISDFQHDNRIYNRTQAIIKLLNVGLASLSGKAIEETPQFTDDEITLVNEYRNALPLAQSIVHTTLQSYPADKKKNLA